MTTDIITLAGLPPRTGTPSGDGGFDVIPYNASTDAFGDVFLLGLWQRMKKDGTFEVFFHDAPGMTFAQFVRELTIEGQAFIGMLVKRNAAGEAIDHVGMVGVGQVILHDRLKRGVGSFVFFRDHWGADTHGAAQAALRIIFGDAPGLALDVLAGVTPERNRRALDFIRQMGFVSVGTLPGFVLYRGEPCGAVISYLSKESWRTSNGLR